MQVAKVTVKNIRKFVRVSLLRLRKFVLWIPVLTFIIGASVSAYVYKSLQAREVEALRADSIQRYKEMINQLDLLFSNSILRIQSYEDYLGAHPKAYREDANFIQHSMSFTIFQRFSIYEHVKKDPKNKEFPEMKLRFRLDTKNSVLPAAGPATHITSDTVNHALQRMMETDSLQTATLHTFLDVPRVSFILRARTNKDIYFVFTSPMSAVFAKTDLRPGESLDLTDGPSGLSWRVEADENGQKIVTPNQGTAKKNYLDGYHHYLYVEGLPQSGMKLNFAFNFKKPEQEVSSAGIAGGMSLLLTLLISYLFLVLVRQNTLVTKLVIEKTHDLEKAHHELQEVLLGKSRFLGNISHEIRTPLNLILGMIDLCEEEDRNKKISEYLKSMRASGNHLQSMIEDLLDLAKSESNDLQINLKKINLIQFLEETSRIAGQDFLKKNLRFYTQFAQDLPISIQGDASRLRQILMNLLRNACKYTSSGHVIFRAYRVGGQGASTTLRFEIEDTGVGIAEDKLGRIFDAFFQVESSYILAEGGVGLGLAIVRELVRKLNGRLNVQSRQKSGSVFSVELDVESLDVGAWVESYRPPEEVPRELVVISRDPHWMDSVACLGRHSHIRLNYVRPDNAEEYLRNHAMKEPRWILLDATLDGFSMSLIKTDESIGRVIIVGNRRNLMDQIKDPRVVVTDNSPLLVTDVLTAMAFTAKSRRRQEKKESVVNNGNVVDSIVSSPLSLIVADDDIGNKELYMAYFEKTAWNIHFAMNGKEAWDLYLKNPSDVLVLDLRMPVMDGFEVVHKVREYELAHSLTAKPILLVTADALDSTADKALALPKVSFLTKPIKKSVLFDSIQKAINV